MKNHVLWLALLVAALFIATIVFLRKRESAVPPSPVQSERRPPSESPFSPPPANLAAPAMPKPVLSLDAAQTIAPVPIERDERKERAVIGRSLKKIERTVGGVKFGPLPPPPRPEKTTP